MSEDEGIHAKLEQIAGGVKLIDTKLDASNRIQDERHDRIQGDLKDLRERVHRNANGIQDLFGWRHSIEGERKGWIASGKLLHILVTVGIIGIGGILAKLLA